MSSPPRAESADTIEEKLPAYDWVLLPCIGLLSIVLLAACLEFTARCLYPSKQIGFDNCFAKNDPTEAAPVKANGVCSERMVESGLTIEYKYNSHGHRAGTELTAKQPGTYRIVLIGSSMAMGLFVPREKTFAGILPDELSRLTGRHVQLYNEATGGKFRGGPFPTSASVKNFTDALSAQPDMILWVVTPMDVENLTAPVPLSEADAPTTKSDSPQQGTILARLRNRWTQSTTYAVFRHLLLISESQEAYINSYLKNEADAGFLRVVPNEQWQSAFNTLSADANGFARQAIEAGVPFVTVLIPNRAQAAMIARNERREGYDPYSLGNYLRSVVQRSGGLYLDILQDLRSVPNPEQDYFPVDGHLNVDGHSLMAQLLAKEITGGAVPDLKRGAQSTETKLDN